MSKIIFRLFNAVIFGAYLKLFSFKIVQAPLMIVTHYSWLKLLKKKKYDDMINIFKNIKILKSKIQPNKARARGRGFQWFIPFARNFRKLTNHIFFFFIMFNINANYDCHCLTFLSST